MLKFINLISIFNTLQFVSRFNFLLTVCVYLTILGCDQESNSPCIDSNCTEEDQHIDMMIAGSNNDRELDSDIYTSFFSEPLDLSNEWESSDSSNLNDSGDLSDSSDNSDNSDHSDNSNGGTDGSDSDMAYISCDTYALPLYEDTELSQMLKSHKKMH